MEQLPVVQDGFDVEADSVLRAGKREYAIAYVPAKTVSFKNGYHQSSCHSVKDTFHISSAFLKNLFWKEQ